MFICINSKHVSVCSRIVCAYWHTSPNHATLPNNHTVLCVGAFGFSFVQTITNNLTFHIKKIAGMWLGGPSMDCGNGGSVYYIRIEKSAFRRGFEYFWFQVGIWAVAHAQHVEWTCWCAVKWSQRCLLSLQMSRIRIEKSTFRRGFGIVGMVESEQEDLAHWLCVMYTILYQ